MKTILLSIILSLALTANSQCTFNIDTVIQTSTFNVNSLNSVQLQTAGFFIDSVFSDSGTVRFQHVALSDTTIFNWYDIYIDCTGGSFQITVYDSSCNVLLPASGSYQMPFSNWNGSPSNRYITIPGATYTYEMVFDRHGGKCRDVQFAFWAYAVGGVFLGTDVELIFVFKDPYPNPSNEIIHFDLPEEEMLIEVYDSDGRLITVDQKGEGSANYDFGTSDLNNGMYHFRFTNNTGKGFSKSVIVKH